MNAATKTSAHQQNNLMTLSWKARRNSYLAHYCFWDCVVISTRGSTLLNTFFFSSSSFTKAHTFASSKHCPWTKKILITINPCNCNSQSILGFIDQVYFGLSDQNAIFINKTLPLHKTSTWKSVLAITETAFSYLKLCSLILKSPI